MTGSYEDFKNGVYALMGIVLDGYKESQMKRRIDSLIERSRVPMERVLSARSLTSSLST